MKLQQEQYKQERKIRSKEKKEAEKLRMFELKQQKKRESIRDILEIKMSNLKGLTKLTGKGDLQRKIDEKMDYINRLKVGLSTIVRNSGFENMNEFLLTFRECRNAYTDYQRQYEGWKNACGNPDIPTHKDENLSDKLVRLQRKAAENHNSIGRQTKDRGTR